MQTLMNWAVTICGGIYMAGIVAMAYRFAQAPGVGGRRRQWLLAGAAFLAIAWLLASIGIYYGGPVRVATSPFGWVTGGLLVYVTYTVSIAWARQLINRR